MKNLLLVGVAVSTLFMVSCNNELESNLSNAESKLQTKVIEKSIEVSDVAQLISMVEIDDEIMNEVKMNTEYSRKYGLDEEYRFTDMIKPNESKIYRSDHESALIRKMRIEYENQNSNELCSNFFESLANTDIQIYWPYSENWDHSEKPIIVYGSEDGKFVYQIKKDNNKCLIDTISISDKYLKENTIWIISMNNTSYEELPDFYNNEFVNKDGVVFLSKYASEKMNENRMSRKAEVGVYLDKIEALHSFEGGLAGGPELQFIWCHGGGLSLITPTTGFVNTYRYNMTLSEVGQPVQLNYRIRPYWPNEEITNVLVVLEKDGGKERTGTRNIKYKDMFGKEITLTSTFKYQKNDDTIFDEVFEQKKICGEDNYTVGGELKQYKNKDRDFWVTIAVQNN